MSHESHGHHEAQQEEKPIVQFRAAWYFVLIVAGLFIGAIAFVKSMSHDEGGHGDAHATHASEHGHDAAPAHHEEGAAAEHGASHGEEAEHH